MAVVDRTGRIGLKELSTREKFDILAATLYINGKPTLRGPLYVRMKDSIVVRIFGMLFNLGEKATTDENEYRRLTGNFKRIGKIARSLAFLGPINRLLLRMAMSMAVHTLGRQKLLGLDNEKTNVHTAAARYFAATDFFDFKIEVDKVEDAHVEFRFLECPIGYVSGDDMKICMATNKWDRQCVRMMGVRMLIEELIPEGAPVCRAHIVPEGRKVSADWRRYPRLAI